MESDEELVRRIGRRDAEAFDAIMARHGEAVRARLLRIVRDAAAADDLAQEVFLRVWTRVSQWDGRGPFAAWLGKLATNMALNHLRSIRRRRQQPLQAQPTAGEEASDLAPGWMVDASALGPDEVLEQAEQRERANRLIDELPEQMREVLRMVHEDEMSLRDVAEALGIPEGTVKSRVHYALKRLSWQWRQMEQGWENT